MLLQFSLGLKQLINNTCWGPNSAAITLQEKNEIPKVAFFTLVSIRT